MASEWITPEQPDNLPSIQRIFKGNIEKKQPGSELCSEE